MPVMGKSKKEALTEFRTAEILEAARKVFAEKGFHDATIDDVAGRAGVAKWTVYLYYRSKHQLYWAALKHGILTMNEETQKKVEAARTLEDKLHAFVAMKLTYFEENRDFFKIYHSEFGNALFHPAHIRKDFTDLYLRQARVLETVLREAVRRKAIRNIRPNAAAFAISDLTRGMITQRLLGWSKAAVDDDIAFVFQLVWKGIAGR
jgi:AcrR family transcriptional regulator